MDGLRTDSLALKGLTTAQSAVTHKHLREERSVITITKHASGLELRFEEQTLRLYQGKGSIR